MTPIVPARAARMHFVTEGATGFDALLLLALTLGIPLLGALAKRVIALKILRGFGLVGERIWREFWSRGRVLRVAVTFEAGGRLYEILDTRGSTAIR